MNASDAAVLLIDNEEVVVIESHARRSIQAGVRCRPAVTTKAGTPIACNGINSPPRVDLSDALVAGIGNKQVLAGVYGNSNGTVQASARGRASVTAESWSAVAGNCGDGAVMDLSDSLVAEVCNEKVAVGVSGHRNRELEARADRRTVVATESRSAVAGHCGDDAVSNPPDAMVECIGDKEIALSVCSHSTGEVQTTTDGGVTIAAEVGCTITARCGDSAARAYFSDTVVERVGDEEVAVVVDGHCLGEI